MSDRNITTETASTIVEDMDNVRHMLGMASNVKQKDWGYRNYYCANPGDASMLRLEAMGLIRKGADRGEHVYWHATEAGCKAVGLNAKQTERAIYGS